MIHQDFDSGTNREVMTKVIDTWNLPLKTKKNKNKNQVSFIYHFMGVIPPKKRKILVSTVRCPTGPFPVSPVPVLSGEVDQR